MVGWHRRLNGHEFGQVLGVGDGQGSLACSSPWGRKSDMTERLNSTVLGLHCWVGFSLVANGGYSSVAVDRLLFVVACLVAEHGL